jgi:quercetin dioxygenase-like cupin family protein
VTKDWSSELLPTRSPGFLARTVALLQEASDQKRILGIWIGSLEGEAISGIEIGTRAADDPRVHARPFTQHGMTYQPLTRRPGGLQAYKLIIPAIRPQVEPDPQAHEGYEWLYVLTGKLRLVLGAHDLVLHAGEAAEFDTRVPHCFDRAGRDAVELLSLFSAQGERIHVRARPAQDRSLD